MVISFPETVRSIVRKCAGKYPANIEKAVDDALKQIKVLPEYGDLVEDLIRSAVQELVYDCRHATSRQIKQNNGAYGGRAKVVMGSSKGVNRAMASVYDMPIAGTVLGLIFGRELGDIGMSERRCGEGHIFNAELCEELSRIVPKNKRVKEVIPERRLKQILRQVRSRSHSAA